MLLWFIILEVFRWKRREGNINEFEILKPASKSPNKHFSFDSKNRKVRLLNTHRTWNHMNDITLYNHSNVSIYIGQFCFNWFHRSKPTVNDLTQEFCYSTFCNKEKKRQISKLRSIFWRYGLDKIVHIPINFFPLPHIIYVQCSKHPFKNIRVNSNIWIKQVRPLIFQIWRSKKTNPVRTFNLKIFEIVLGLASFFYIALNIN